MFLRKLVSVPHSITTQKAKTENTMILLGYEKRLFIAYIPLLLAQEVQCPPLNEKPAITPCHSSSERIVTQPPRRYVSHNAKLSQHTLAGGF
jgi:hypothetical protein